MRKQLVGVNCFFRIVQLCSTVLVIAELLLFSKLFSKYLYILSFPKKCNMLYCYRSVVKKYAYRMRENMSEENQRTPADRRRRVQALKKWIILMLVLCIATPCVLCVILFVRVNTLNRNIDRITLQLEQLTGISSKQGEKLEELIEGLREEGTGAVNATEASNTQTKIGNLQNNTAIEENEEAITGVTETPLEDYKHKVYLTFDDGPSIYTDEILDILDRYDIKATFFVVGKESDSAKEALCRIVEEGHTLGMHSYSHKYKEVYRSVDAFAEDFWKLRDYLYEVTGVESSVYRFPGGSSNTVSSIDMWEFADYLDSQDVVFFDWNISSGDAGSTLLDVDTLVENCTADITERENSVILMHDSANRHTTIEALPIIIENILALEDTVILPITEETEPVQHIHKKSVEK